MNLKQETVTFFRAYPDAISPMRAEKSALGTMPTMAYRHCEPMRTASSFGWYFFPPVDIQLKWDGSDTFVRQGRRWQPLTQQYLPGFEDYWNSHAPSDLKGLVPPYISRLPIRGVIQIWTGFFCKTKPGWSVLIKPPVNIHGSNFYSAFEGIVESDHFGPFPLFMNIQLHATNVPIELIKLSPLLQLQPLRRDSYSEEAHLAVEKVGLAIDNESEAGLSKLDWKGYRNAIRVEDASAPPEFGRYTRDTRIRSKK
jgi:Family of unknown function (DUF6065)